MPLSALLLLTAGLTCPETARAQADSTSLRAESLALVEQAAELAQEGRLAESAGLYRRAIALDRRNAAAYLGLSSVLFRRRAHADAVAELEAARQLVDNVPAVEAQLGIHLVAQGKYAQARDILGAVAYSDPTGFEAPLYLGQASLHLGDWGAAVRALRSYLERRPESLAGHDARAQTGLALAYARLGQYVQAEQTARGILAAHAEHKGAQLVLATVQAATGRCEQALPLLATLAESHGAQARTIDYNRALCLHRGGRHKQALGILGHRRHQGTRDARVLALRARIQLAAGETASAIGSYEAALAAGAPVEVEAARLLHAAGRNAEAARIIGPVVAQPSADAEALTSAAQVYLATAEVGRAAEVAARLTALAPKQAGSHHLHGRALQAQGRATEAAASFRRALELEPGHAEARAGLRLAYERLAKAAVQGGRPKEAEPLLDAALALGPAAHLVCDRALLALSAGQAGLARRLLASGGGQGSRARLLSGLAAMQLGDVAGARQLLADVADDRVAAPAERVQALVALARLARGEPALAVPLLERARAGASPEQVPDIDRQLAWARLQMAQSSLVAGRAEEARAQIRALRELRDLPPAWTARVDLLAALAKASSEGYEAGLEELEGIGATALQQAFDPGVSPAAVPVARLLAAYVARNLRPIGAVGELVTSHRGLPAAIRERTAELLAAWLDGLLYATQQSGDRRAVERVLRSLPSAVTRPTLAHNAAVVRSLGTRSAPLPGNLLQRLAKDVPEAHVNAAIAAERQQDHQGAAEHLRRAVAARAAVPGLAEWLTWKEMFYPAEAGPEERR